MSRQAASIAGIQDNVPRQMPTRLVTSSAHKLPYTYGTSATRCCWKMTALKVTGAVKRQTRGGAACTDRAGAESATSASR